MLRLKFVDLFLLLLPVFAEVVIFFPHGDQGMMGRDLFDVVDLIGLFS